MPVSAWTCGALRTNRRRRGASASPERRRAGSAVPARNREASQRGEQPGGHQGRRADGAHPGLPPARRAGLAARCESRSAAPLSTTPLRRPTQKPAPVRTTQRSVPRNHCGPAVPAAFDPKGHGNRTYTPDRGRGEYQGRSGAGTQPWHQPDSRDLPAAERIDHRGAGPACGPTPPTAPPRSRSGVTGVLGAPQASCWYRPRSPLPGDLLCTWRPPLR